MDTSHLEYVAEDLISHKLQHAGLLVAKPKFDKKGTDLLAFAKMADGVKFCRIQCKGRTIKSSSNVTIPEQYVTSGFVFFLYIEPNDNVNNLYCFIESDIKTWNKNPKNEYQLCLSLGTYTNNLAPYRFDGTKIKLIQKIIEAAEVNGEFRRMVYGSINVTLEDSTMEALGTVGPAK
jgi:hypothetical protein